MATTQTLETRQSREILCIDSILEAHHELAPHRHNLEISLEGSRVTIEGHLPNASLNEALVPAIRQAGVLGQIQNRVQIG